MKILTLNINMFNFDINNSLNSFFNEYRPDVAMIQECRYTKTKDINEYSKINPIGYELEQEINGTHFITMAFHKEEMLWYRGQETLKYFGRCYVEINSAKHKKDNGWSVLGVHIPLDTDNNRKKGLQCLAKAIIGSEADVICGDFNASLKNTESLNGIVIDEMKKKGYMDLWEKGLKNNKAYYIDYTGEEKKADASKFYRTYGGNTRIDYVFAKGIVLTKIVLDMRTLVFSDHCAIIVECEKSINIPTN